jgi:hypothetical protein
MPWSVFTVRLTIATGAVLPTQQSVPRKVAFVERLHAVRQFHPVRRIVRLPSRIVERQDDVVPGTMRVAHPWQAAAQG